MRTPEKFANVVKEISKSVVALNKEERIAVMTKKLHIAFINTVHDMIDYANASVNIATNICLRTIHTAENKHVIYISLNGDKSVMLGSIAADDDHSVDIISQSGDIICRVPNVTLKLDMKLAYNALIALYTQTNAVETDVVNVFKRLIKTYEPREFI